MRLLLHALVFCAVFLAVARALGGALTALDAHLEEPGTKSIKSDHYRAHADDFDVVFVGSSRVFRQFDPATFEATARGLGMEVTAYNMGAPGMRFFESLLYVDWILARGSERLRWIVFELQDPEPVPNEGLRFTHRNVRWHTPELSSVAIGRVMSSERSPGEKLAESFGHLGQGLLRISNAGTALPLFRDLLGWRRISADTTRTGFIPLDATRTAEVRERRAKLEAELEENPDLFAAKGSAFLQEEERPAPAWVVELLRGMVSRARLAGVEVLFVLSPPSEDNYLALSALRRDETLPRVFLYDPAKYPLLYFEPSLRFDHNHLDAVGAEKLTELFARQFVRHVERTGG